MVSNRVGSSERCGRYFHGAVLISMGCDVHVRVARECFHGFSGTVRCGLSIIGTQGFGWCLSCLDRCG